MDIFLRHYVYTLHSTTHRRVREPFIEYELWTVVFCMSMKMCDCFYECHTLCQCPTPDPLTTNYSYRPVRSGSQGFWEDMSYKDEMTLDMRFTCPFFNCLGRPHQSSSSSTCCCACPSGIAGDRGGDSVPFCSEASLSEVPQASS